MKTNGQSPVYRIAADVCFSTDNDGTIILDVQGGKFHSLIQSGSKVWSILAAHDEGTTQAALVDELMNHDEAFAQEPRAEIESAIQRVLQQLTRDGLLETDRSHASSVLQRFKCRLCVAGASAVRHTGNTLIRFRGVHAAAFIEFAF